MIHGTFRCPFCGLAFTRHVDKTDEGAGHFFECVWCGARGPACTTFELAEKCWFERGSYILGDIKDFVVLRKE